jgi:SAM-dependent methyltransferase
MSKSKPDLKESYDSVAEQYAAEYSDELSRKPFDCELLEGFAAELRDKGEVLEIGCGPGQVARFLKDRGVEMRGLDLSSEMVKCAGRLNPDISFKEGDMLALKVGDGSFAGVVSFYAIIHLQREDVSRALKEMYRVLQPGGKLLISFHGGDGVLHRDEWYDKPVSIDVSLFSRDEMKGYLEAAGFAVDGIAEREPYEFEYPTKRMYASAKKPL